MKLTQEENFFPNLDLILPQIKKIPLYNIDDIKKISENPGVWPGLRSELLGISCPILHEFIVNLILQKKYLKGGDWQINSFLHLRLKEHETDDWIHKDPDEYSALIYLSNSNLSSGTKLYDENENVINDIKFVKNRYIMYSGSYKHMAYGHHGSSIEDGRLTLNIFFNRINNGS
tara:strand:- start:3165 stop:3686 length:522 start_codon:yes stop_codon:yes gene_type:complete